MKNSTHNIEKYNLDNIKAQVLLFVVPVAYYYFYSAIFELQGYLYYTNLQWIYDFLSYVYYLLGVCCLIATVALTIKTPKGVVRYIDYLVRAFMISSHAIRFFIIYTLEEKLNNIPYFLITIANLIAEIPKPEMFIFFASILSFFRIIHIIAVRRGLRKQTGKNNQGSIL